MDLDFSRGNLFVVNDRIRGEETWLDITTDRMILKKHGITRSAKKVKPTITLKYVEFANHGESGFFFVRLNDDDYKDFNDAYLALTNPDE